jgi:hypothetical protein
MRIFDCEFKTIMSRAFKLFEAQKAFHKRPISNVILFLYIPHFFPAHYQCKVLDVEQSVAADSQQNDLVMPKTIRFFFTIHSTLLD